MLSWGDDDVGILAVCVPSNRFSKPLQELERVCFVVESGDWQVEQVGFKDALILSMILYSYPQVLFCVEISFSSQMLTANSKVFFENQSWTLRPAIICFSHSSKNWTSETNWWMSVLLSSSRNGCSALKALPPSWTYGWKTGFYTSLGVGETTKWIHRH